MDDYILAPSQDDYTFEQMFAVLVEGGPEEPYVAPSNIQDFVGTRTWGGVG